MIIITFIRDTVLPIWYQEDGEAKMTPIGMKTFVVGDAFVADDHGPGIQDDRFYYLQRVGRGGNEINAVILADDRDVEVTEMEELEV
jgi:hypothetical protein